MQEGDHQQKIKTLLEIKGELDAGQTKTTGGTTEIHFIYEENKVTVYGKSYCNRKPKRWSR